MQKPEVLASAAPDTLFRVCRRRADLGSACDCRCAPEEVIKAGGLPDGRSSGDRGARCRCSPARSCCSPGRGLRIGAPGIAVRNLLGYKLIPWSDVIGVTFPRGARWARVDLPDDEYMPAMAIQAVEGRGPCRRGDGQRSRPAGPLPARPQRTLSDIADLVAGVGPLARHLGESEAFVHASLADRVVHRHPERDSMHRCRSRAHSTAAATKGRASP